MHVTKLSNVHAYVMLSICSTSIFLSHFPVSKKVNYFFSEKPHDENNIVDDNSNIGDDGILSLKILLSQADFLAVL